MATEPEKLQRCMKSVEAISAEIQPAIAQSFFERHIKQLQQLTSQEADNLGRWSFPVILDRVSHRYRKISRPQIYRLAETAFKITPERVASYSSGRSNYTHGIVLALMTGRGYAQHNTVVYRTEDKYRGLSHRNCIIMNPLDATSAGLQEHQRVTVKGNANYLDNIEIVYGEVRRAAALMFYPEVNVIFDAPVDSRCGTPAFKRVPVLVYTSQSKLI